MPNSLPQKLKIKDNDTLLIINAPTNFKAVLIDLPKGVTISSNTKSYQQIHWFVKDRKQMENELSKILKLLKDDVLCWIYYPKGSSGMQTDLTRDKGWDELLKHDELQWISLISFDDTWSTFAFRLKTEKDKKKETLPNERPIFEYIDAAKKLVRLPEDFQKALKKSKKANEFLDSLSSPIKRNT